MGALLVHLNMGQYRAPFAQHGITGVMLVDIEKLDELAELGMTTKAHARGLLRSLAGFKTTGVPLSALES